jgi:hypothetical protein
MWHSVSRDLSLGVAELANLFFGVSTVPKEVRIDLALRYAVDLEQLRAIN